MRRVVDPMWVTPLHAFKCGACKTTVTGIATLGGVSIVMREHAEVCPGYPPTESGSGIDLDKETA